MKRVLSVLLLLALLMPHAICLADGAETGKPINFSSFNFGDTFSDIRTENYCNGIEFMKGRYSARFLADAYQGMAQVGHWDDQQPWCFMAGFDGIDKVAGHQASAKLWFVYPVVNDAVVYSESDAVFYGGQYNFYQGDKRETFEDLKSKLAKVYGEAYYTGSDLSAVLGELPLSEDYMNNYNEETARLSPEYAVWKSSANNAYAVLVFYMQNGEEPFTRLVYVSMDGEEYFAKMQEMSEAGTGNVDSDSLEGL